MIKVFIYDKNVNWPNGLFAKIDGFRLVTEAHTFDNTIEAIRDDNECIYGYIYEISEDTLDSLDAYYGLGIGMHDRIQIQAILNGGATLDVYLYEYIVEEPVK